MTTLLINSKSDVRRPIPETRQHNKKKDTEEAKSNDDWQSHHDNRKGRRKVSPSHINSKKPHRRGDLFPRSENFFFLGLLDFWLFELHRILPRKFTRREGLKNSLPRDLFPEEKTFRFNYAQSTESFTPLYIHYSWYHKWA